MSETYTRTGDDGTSGLLGDKRVQKDHPRLEALGAIDEANSALGLARAFCPYPDLQNTLITIQRDLYHIMAEVAATPDNSGRFRVVDNQRVLWLEEVIDSFEKRFDIPNEFIVPGDSQAGAFLDLARAIVRKAERRLSTLTQQGEIKNPALLSYLNRLSSLCFILGLWVAQTLNDISISLAKDGES